MSERHNCLARAKELALSQGIGSTKILDLLLAPRPLFASDTVVTNRRHGDDALTIDWEIRKRIRESDGVATASLVVLFTG